VSKFPAAGTELLVLAGDGFGVFLFSFFTFENVTSAGAEILTTMWTCGVSVIPSGAPVGPEKSKIENKSYGNMNNRVKFKRRNQFQLSLVDICQFTVPLGLALISVAGANSSGSPSTIPGSGVASCEAEFSKTVGKLVGSIKLVIFTKVS
jgi:hypothetical protein